MPEVSTKFDRLPKWAQEELSNLRRDTKHLEAEIERLSNDNKGSNVAILRGVSGEEFRLPGNSAIAFYVSDPRLKYPTYVLVRHIQVFGTNKPRLYVSTNGPRLLVLPSASNSIHLETDDR